MEANMTMITRVTGSLVFVAGNSCWSDRARPVARAMGGAGCAARLAELPRHAKDPGITGRPYPARHRVALQRDRVGGSGHRHGAEPAPAQGGCLRPLGLSAVARSTATCAAAA